MTCPGGCWHPLQQRPERCVHSYAQLREQACCQPTSKQTYCMHLSQQPQVHDTCPAACCVTVRPPIVAEYCIPCHLSLACWSLKAQLCLQPSPFTAIGVLAADAYKGPRAQGRASLCRLADRRTGRSAGSSCIAVGGQRRADGCQRHAMPHGPAPRCAARRLGGDEGAAGSGKWSGLPCGSCANPEQAAWAGWVSLRAVLLHTQHLQPERACVSKAALRPHSTLLFPLSRHVLTRGAEPSGQVDVVLSG